MQQNADHLANADFMAKTQEMVTLHNQLLRTIQHATVTRDDLKEPLKKAARVILEASIALDDHATGVMPLSQTTLATVAGTMREAQVIVNDVVLAFATLRF